MNKDEKIKYYKSILVDNGLNPDEKQRIIEDDFVEFGNALEKF